MPVKNRPTKSLRRKPGEVRTYGHRNPIEERQDAMRARMPQRSATAATAPLGTQDSIRHATTPEELQSVGLTPEQAEAILNDRLKASAIDPSTLQLIMAVSAAVGRELRKPSLKEEKKEAEAAERLKAERLRAAEDGQRVKEQIEAFQGGCGHVKRNGEHRWRGQVHSDGWAVVRCMACLLTYRVRATPQMMSGGMNLDQIPGLTLQHIKAWAANSAALDTRLKAAEKHMKELNRTMQAGPQALGEPIPIPL